MYTSYLGVTWHCAVYPYICNKNSRDHANASMVYACSPCLYARVMASWRVRLVGRCMRACVCTWWAGTQARRAESASAHAAFPCSSVPPCLIQARVRECRIRLILPAAVRMGAAVIGAVWCCSWSTPGVSSIPTPAVDRTSPVTDGALQRNSRVATAPQPQPRPHGTARAHCSRPRACVIGAGF